ncbi:MAG: phage antirepressor KilAC domain-containing protein [Muribaculaceae bacterium]|nr:phage antirepressor KilAC domain-containing protein [Muribaculaceae bacterium]
MRWEELETASQPRVPQSFREALLLAAEQQEQIERQQRLIAEREAQLREEAPKVLFAEAVAGSRSTCLIGELAKIISQNGYPIGQNRLFEWMRDNSYLGTRGEQYNIPHQRYIEMGLFELKKGVRSGSDGVMRTTLTPKVTGKGQQYFINKFLGR